MIAAAERSETAEESKIPRGPATSGEQAIVSFGTSFRTCARGFSAPFLWFFQAIRVMASFSVASSTPYFLPYSRPHRLDVAGPVVGARLPAPTAPRPGRPARPEPARAASPGAARAPVAPQRGAC